MLARWCSSRISQRFSEIAACLNQTISQILDTRNSQACGTAARAWRRGFGWRSLVRVNLTRGGSLGVAPQNRASLCQVSPLDTGKSRPAKSTYSIGEAVSLMEVKHGWQRQRSFGGNDLFQNGQKINREAFLVDRSDMFQEDSSRAIDNKCFGDAVGSPVDRASSRGVDSDCRERIAVFHNDWNGGIS